MDFADALIINTKFGTTDEEIYVPFIDIKNHIIDNKISIPCVTLSGIPTMDY